MKREDEREQQLLEARLSEAEENLTKEMVRWITRELNEEFKQYKAKMLEVAVKIITTTATAAQKKMPEVH